MKKAIKKITFYCTLIAVAVAAKFFVIDNKQGSIGKTNGVAARMENTSNEDGASSGEYQNNSNSNQEYGYANNNGNSNSYSSNHTTSAPTADNVNEV
ncbi:MAG: hypothetical protein ACOVOV_10105, partial [Dolichospermum sp.]